MRGLKTKPQSSATTRQINNSNWFEDWFGDEYLTVYPHRDLTEAQTVAKLIRSRVNCLAGTPALDLACGAGRLHRLLQKYHWTIGIDLSSSLLRLAKRADHDALLVRADMRILPFRSAAFALVVNLFTSFGYFSDDAQNEKVIAEVARVTKENGWFVLDFLNAQRVRRTLVPFDRRQIGALVIQQEREISSDGRYVRKFITVNRPKRTFMEQVRLFELKDLTAMLQGCGFVVTDVLGNYQGAPVTHNSPRTILIAKRLGTLSAEI
jgi:ubiquinone/menaquinone biosynthesis C-methylase UbiE